MSGGNYFIAYVDGRYQVYRVVNGRYRLNVGPKWATPKEAALYVERMDAMPETSPLRESAHI